MVSQKISFKINNQNLTGHLIIPKNIKEKNPAVIFVHGMTSSENNYLPLAEACSENGIICLTINLRGHGTSDGNFSNLTVNDITSDGLAAYDFLIQQKGVDKNRIGLCGASVGAHIAMMVSEKRKVKSLILRAPAIYTKKSLSETLHEVMEQEGKIFKQIKNTKDTKALQVMEKFPGSFLLVVSENDQIIPKTIPTDIFTHSKSAKKKETITISKATHNLNKESWRKEWREQVVQWFQLNL